MLKLQEKIVRVGLQNRGYNTYIGLNILNKIGKIIKNVNIGNAIFIITDRKVNKLYGQRVIKNLRAAGFSDIGKFVISDGEESKSWDTYREINEKVYEFEKYQDKKIVIVTLGGGVVGDLGGLVAQTYRRGISYIQIPTTLLGQVDCGLGGKVGINLKEAKNLIGGFWQPKLVCMDIAVLKTLDRRELKSGLAEVIKYGVIKDSKLFEYVEGHLDQIAHYDLRCLNHIILTCVKIKAKITQLDERDDKDIRIKLNFGHTIGHAIEAASSYKIYKHGEAISIGMLCAGEIACRLGLFSNKDFLKLDSLIEKAGLPKKIRECSLKDIMKSMRYDKKFIGGLNRFVLPVKIGKVRIKEGIDENLIKDVIRERMVSA